MSNEIRERILRVIKENTDKVIDVTAKYEYDKLTGAIKNPNLDIVQQYFDGEGEQ